MPRFPLTRRTVLGTAIAPLIGTAKQSKTVLEAVKSMLTRDGLRIVDFGEFGPLLNRLRAVNRYGAIPARAFAVAPDGNTLCTGVWREAGKPSPVPVLMIVKQGGEIEPFWLDGQSSENALGISSDAKTAVAKVIALAGKNQRAVVALDLASMTATNLTKFLRELAVSEIEDISVSGSGEVAAIGSRQKIEVLEIPSGRAVAALTGWMPRLSPDGKRLAFIEKERMFIRSMADGSIIEPLSGARVMGTGAWSPNGRYVLAGAWTKSLALEKRLVVVDATSGDFSVAGKLGEGDFGNHAVWASEKLLTSLAK